MNAAAVTKALEKIKDSDHFVADAYQLTDAWSKDPNSFDAVEPILRFMENHREVDYGAPGPLVHFVEGFSKRGYEEKLLQSIERRPTVHTLNMLNAVINGTKAPRERERLILVLKQAQKNPITDPLAREQAGRLLHRLAA